MMFNGDDELLGRLRQWLEHTRAETELPNSDGYSLDEQSMAVADVGIHRLIEEFTALRHEVKLQIRNGRGLEDQLGTLVPALQTALQTSIDALRSAEATRSAPPSDPSATATIEASAKSFAMALAELDESLERGKRQLERIATSTADDVVRRALCADVDQAFARQSWIRRKFSKTLHASVKKLLLEDPRIGERKAALAAVLEGFTLIQARLARAMAAQQIERIAAVGSPVDLERMIVVEVVPSFEQPGLVIEEIRRGYTWNGKLLRTAEVRVTKSFSPESNR